MPSIQGVPLLLGILIGLVLSLVVCMFWRTRKAVSDAEMTAIRDDILIGLFALACFALGVFLTYALLMGVRLY